MSLIDGMKIFFVVIQSNSTRALQPASKVSSIITSSSLKTLIIGFSRELQMIAIGFCLAASIATGSGLNFNAIKSLMRLFALSTGAHACIDAVYQCRVPSMDRSQMTELLKSLFN
jgi:hypothetical protein